MDKTIKILLVEDDNTLQFIIKDNLEQQEYSVSVAQDGEEAINLYNNNFHLVLLDIMLPKIDGFKVAEYIRSKNKNIPIIFLTARSLPEDKIKGLTIGGDDYILKPFIMEELLLKIKIFLKRSNINQIYQNNNSPSKKIGQFIFHPDELILLHDNKIRKLTLKEMEILKYFSENRNKVLTRNEILKHIWGSDDYFLGRSLDVFISRLRKYLKPDPNIKIVNLHGIGFRFSIKNEKKT